MGNVNTRAVRLAHLLIKKPATERENLAVAIDIAGRMAIAAADEVRMRDVAALGRKLQLLPESPPPKQPLLTGRRGSERIWLSEWSAQRRGPFLVVETVRGEDTPATSASPPMYCYASNLPILYGDRAKLVGALIWELARRVRLLGDPTIRRRFELEVEGASAALAVMTS